MAWNCRKSCGQKSLSATHHESRSLCIEPSIGQDVPPSWARAPIFTSSPRDGGAVNAASPHDTFRRKVRLGPIGHCASPPSPV